MASVSVQPLRKNNGHQVPTLADRPDLLAQLLEAPPPNPRHSSLSANGMTVGSYRPAFSLLPIDLSFRFHLPFHQLIPIMYAWIGRMQPAEHSAAFRQGGKTQYEGTIHESENPETISHHNRSH